MSDRGSGPEAGGWEVRRGSALPRVTATPDDELFSPAGVWSSATPDAEAEPTEGTNPPANPYRETDVFPSREISTEFFKGTRRSKRRFALFGTIGAVVVAAVAVPLAVTLSSSGSGHHAAQSPPKPAKVAAPAPTAFSAITGPGCGGNAYTQIGYYVEGKSGWLAGKGAYSGKGCDGRFDALPMSGDAKKADPTLYARWAFDPGSHRRCKVAMYIPNDRDEVRVGGSPAEYSIQPQRGNTSLLKFSIDQPKSRGRWVDSPPFSASGPFYIHLANTGTDWTGTNSFAHVAAAQARATCD